MPRLRGTRALGRTCCCSVVVILAGCTGGKSSPSSSATVVVAPGPSSNDAAPSSPTNGVSSTEAAPYSTIDQVLRATPVDATARRRLRATALFAGAQAQVRYAALHSLELGCPKGADTFEVASALASLSSTDSPESRFLAENGAATLTRIDTPEARAALARLQGAPASAATALAAKGKGG